MKHKKWSIHFLFYDRYGGPFLKCNIFQRIISFLDLSWKFCRNLPRMLFLLETLEKPIICWKYWYSNTWPVGNLYVSITIDWNYKFNISHKESVAETLKYYLYIINYSLMDLVIIILKHYSYIFHFSLKYPAGNAETAWNNPPLFNLWNK